MLNFNVLVTNGLKRLLLGLGPLKTGTLDLSQNSTKNTSGDFKQVSEEGAL